MESGTHTRTNSWEEDIFSHPDFQHFLQLAAHDLQAPLNAIAAFTQLLHEECAGKVGDQAEQYMHQVLDNTQRMHTLIRDLLIYAQVDAQAAAFEPANLRKVFDEVLFMLAKPIGEAEAQVTCGDLPILPVNRTQMTRLLLNLMDNALKFRRGKPVRIETCAEQRQGEWLFTVRDNGIGVEPRYHEEIFDIFRRLHSYQAYPGSGVGLAVCRRIVKHHGGRIWVDSREGKGSAFHFTLPDGSRERAPDPAPA